MVKVELVEGQKIIDLLTSPREWMAPMSGSVASQYANVAAVEIRRAAETTRPHPPIRLGKGLKSIRARQVGPTRAIVLQVNYMQFINDGRAAGKPMPPPSKLRPWLRARQREGKLKGVTPYQLARSIQKKGIAPRRFVERGLASAAIEATGEASEILHAAVRREWGIRGVSL